MSSAATRTLRPVPLTPEAFAPFGAVIECGLGEIIPINGGTCERHHALAAIECAGGREPILSIFRAQPRALPMEVAMMERHPLGSQAFVPLEGRAEGGGDGRAWIAVVAPNEAAVNGDGGGDGSGGCGPGAPLAFLCRADQGLSLAPGVWHHPLIVLDARSDFLVADSRGEAPNLEEARYAEPWTLVAGAPSCAP